MHCSFLVTLRNKLKSAFKPKPDNAEMIAKYRRIELESIALLKRREAMIMGDIYRAQELFKMELEDPSTPTKRIQYLWHEIIHLMDDARDVGFMYKDREVRLKAGGRYMPWLV